MRLGLLSILGLFVFGVVANPLKEESSTSVEVAEAVSCDGSHYIVSVQRIDDLKEDSGELIAEKVSNIVFDFKVDRESETLLINGYTLKLVPQSVKKITLFAAVLPPDHPALPESLPIGSVKDVELLKALNNLARNGLITANVEMFLVYENDNRHIGIRVQVVEVEGSEVVHKDLLVTQITLPQRHHHGEPNMEGPPHRRPQHEGPKCATIDVICHISSWIHSPCGGHGKHKPHHGHHGKHKHHHGHHRHRFHHHGFMKFLICVVIPVIIGAAAGIGIGVLSVMAAELIGALILKIRGRRNGGYSEIDAKYEEDLIDEELPVYEVGEESPAYSDEKQ